MRIAIVKEAFNRKMPLLTSKLNIDSRRNWLRDMFVALIYWLRYLDTKKITAEILGKLSNVVLEGNGEDKMARESN